MVVHGKVTKITNFGVFVQLEQGLEGLLHISELSDQKVENPQDIVKPGDEVEIRAGIGGSFYLVKTSGSRSLKVRRVE